MAITRYVLPIMTNSPDSDAVLITPSAGIERAHHGWRAKCLQRLVRMDLPVPRSHAISSDCVQRIAAGHPPEKAMLSRLLGEADPMASAACGLISVRPSAVNPEWGGPGTVLNVGINDQRHDLLASRVGKEAADAVYLHFVQSYATHIARLDPDMFAQDGPGALTEALRSYADEMDEEFPQDPAVQLTEVLRSMARAWEGPTRPAAASGQGRSARCAAWAGGAGHGAWHGPGLLRLGDDPVCRQRDRRAPDHWPFPGPDAGQRPRRR